MTAELRRAVMLAGVGLVGGFALVVAFFGTGELLKRNAPGEPAGTPRQLGELAPNIRKPDAKAEVKAPQTDGSATDSAGLGTGYRAALDRHGPLDPLSREDSGLADGLHAAAPGPDGKGRQGGEGPDRGPRLDVVRIEPSGDTVIAGRVAPDAVVEILRDGQPIARATADPSGQFAIVPPALPSGNSELTLRMSDRAGKTVTGRESVAVVIAPDRNARPLVAISEPDKPTRVLSQPDDAAKAQAGRPAEPARQATEPAKPGTKAAQVAGNEKGQDKPTQRMAALTEPGKKTDAAAPVKIVSVDAQEGGRLHVTGQATAWTSLRLYLNDTMVASGKTDGEGRIAFTIGRGVQAGGYQIRVDQVDAETGKVRNRAQVAFAFPKTLAEKTTGRETLAAPAAGPRPGEARKGVVAEAGKAPLASAPLSSAPSAGAVESAPTRVAEKSKPEQTASVRSGEAKPATPDASAGRLAVKAPPSEPAGEAAQSAGRVVAGTGDGARQKPSADASARASATTETPAKLGPPPQAAKEQADRDLPSIAGKPLAGKEPAATTPPAQTSAASGRASPDAAAMAVAQAGKPNADSDRRSAAALSPTLPGAEAGAARPPMGRIATDDGTRKPEGLPSEAKEMSVLASPPEAAGTVFVPEIGTAKITRGDNLWMISKRNYGSGLRYTVIFDANQDQIRNPDLIYPGQIFVLPKDEGEGARAKRG